MMSRIEFIGTVDGVLVERVNHVAIISIGESRMCIVGEFISYENKKGCGSIRLAKKRLKEAYKWTRRKHGEFYA